ncbi:putative sugar transporter [Aspergillus venezuelensis]
MGASTFLWGLRGRSLALAQLALIVCPSYVLFGYNHPNLGGLVSLSDWRQCYHQGLVIACFTLGALPGCLSCSYTFDGFGRRPVIFVGALLTFIGQVLEASSFHLAQLIIGRTILGAGVGMLSGTVPTWQSECSSLRNRGKHVVLDGLFISLWYFLQAWINLGFYQFETGPVTWRPPVALPCVLSLILMASIFFMPESPRWLARENRVSEAQVTLSALKDSSMDSPEVMTEIASIEVSLEQTANSAGSLLDLYGNGEGRLLYRFGICMLLQFYQQMAGENLISVYSTIIFQQSLSLDAKLSRILSGSTLTWKLLSYFVSFFTIDRLGRRFAFIVSGTGMAACMLGLAVATSFPKSNYPAQIISVLFVFLFNFFLPVGFLGANFLYTTEIAPTRLRVAMSSISTANHWLWNFVVTMITPAAIESIGYKYYIVYTCIGFCIPLSIYFLYPETMGRTLEEIDLIFREIPSILGTVRYAKRRPRIPLKEQIGGKPSSEHDEVVEKSEV